MNYPRISVHSYGIHFFLTALGFFALFYLARFIDVRRNDPEVIRQHIQTVLNEKELKAEQAIAHLLAGKRTDETNGPEPRTGITIFLYRNDTLQSWTGNAVPGQPVVLAGGDLREPSVRLENGFYRVIRKDTTDLTAVAFILVYQQYPFQNDYLENGMQKDFGVPNNMRLSTYHGKYDVNDGSGRFLFSFVPADQHPPARWPGLLFLLFLAGSAFTVLFVYRLYCSLETIFPGRCLFLLSFIADLLILRALQLWIRWPQALYETSLFSPDHYFGSAISPSFGDLIVNTLLLVAMALVIYNKWPPAVIQRQPAGFRKYIIIGGSAILVAIAAAEAVLITGTLVEDSTIPMNLQNLTGLNLLSIEGFGVIAGLYLTLYLFSSALSARIWQLFDPHNGRPFLKTFSGTLVFIILAALLTTIVLNRSNARVEKENRKMIAMKLAARRNPVTEEMFAETGRKITGDSLLQAGLIRGSAGNPDSTDQALARYITSHFFNGYWNNFSIQVTLCRPGKMLRIQPQEYLVPCSDYFSSILREFGKTTSSPGLWYLDYGYGNENYLARVSPAGPGPDIYIEFSLKQAYKDLGYPELLVDRSVSDLPDLSDYSYGYYQDGQLVRRVGQYAYGFELEAISDTAAGSHFFDTDEYNHYLYRIDSDNVMLIGKPHPTLLSRISPFSYLFIWFSVIAVACYFMFRFGRLRRLVTESLRNRLQVAFLGVILSSFIIVGIVVTVFLVRLNAEKDKENLLERALSILVEMQHKFGNTGNLADVPQGEMSNMLVKFSNVFFSDINVYDPGGTLVASSRPQIFEEGLISGLMNPDALARLRSGVESMIVAREHIGRHHYLSAYLPMYNDRNERTGYINLPYFSRQAELRGEVSAFMVAFINIYVLFILTGVIIAFIIAGYLTSPLKMLAQKISRTSLGSMNEKIDWTRNDEVGRLVAEYNRMLDELQDSVEKLAASERESAWREMARQVAHEIKNPLTPMKLSIQYLGKSWDEGAPDWDQRLKRFITAMVEQIDSLSSIATEFSDFAKMPLPVNERLELNEVIHTALSLYKDVAPVKFSFLTDHAERFAFCDRKQLLRVLNNLLNNAIQAIGQDRDGEILISLSTADEAHEIRITDNGPGIPPDQSDKIFHPNFTTKSGGTGLGLAIVKEIITAQGGRISFTSEPDSGTTFILILPGIS